MGKTGPISLTSISPFSAWGLMRSHWEFETAANNRSLQQKIAKDLLQGRNQGNCEGAKQTPQHLENLVFITLRESKRAFGKRATAPVASGLTRHLLQLLPVSPSLEQRRKLVSSRSKGSINFFSPRGTTHLVSAGGKLCCDFTSPSTRAGFQEGGWKSEQYQLTVGETALKRKH